MAITALILYIAWFLLAFGVRTWISWRRTGDGGWRGVSGRPLSLEWFAGVLFGVALAIGVAAPVAGLFGMASLVHTSAIEWAGIAIAVVGVLLTLAAQMSMGDSWRIGVDATERTELVTDGAFRLARNPIFTAMGITAVGLALMIPNVLAVVGLVALLVALHLQVRGVEESYLRTVHGVEYTTYAARVGRFIPGLGRLR